MWGVEETSWHAAPTTINGKIGRMIESGTEKIQIKKAELELSICCWAAPNVVDRDVIEDRRDIRCRTSKAYHFTKRKSAKKGHHISFFICQRCSHWSPGTRPSHRLHFPTNLGTQRSNIISVNCYLGLGYCVCSARSSNVDLDENIIFKLMRRQIKSRTKLQSCKYCTWSFIIRFLIKRLTQSVLFWYGELTASIQSISAARCPWLILVICSGRTQLY